MKIEVLLVFVLFSLSLVSATCDSGQIDINGATLSELDDLAGIGPAKGQAIIDMRPFGSVDDLMDVSGIGPVTLQNIKDQGLACVSGEEDVSNDNSEEDNSDTGDDNGSENNDDSSESSSTKNPSSVSGKVIMELNETPKTIINLKSSKSVEQETKVVYESKNEKIKKYSIYAFAFFLVLVIAYLLFS